MNGTPQTIAALNELPVKTVNVATRTESKREFLLSEKPTV
jgi:hypothetical protein